MKKGRGICFLIAPFIIAVACQNERHGFFHYVNTDHYYDSEIFNNSFKNVYGEWVLQAVSGEVASDAHQPDFQRIVFEKIGMFKVFRNDTLLGFGRVDIRENLDHSLKITFQPDRGLKSISFYNSDKYLSIKEDNLNLFASASNQHNYHFVRLK